MSILTALDASTAVESEEDYVEKEASRMEKSPSFKLAVALKTVNSKTITGKYIAKVVKDIASGKYTFFNHPDSNKIYTHEETVKLVNSFSTSGSVIIPGTSDTVKVFTLKLEGENHIESAANIIMGKKDTIMSLVKGFGAHRQIKESEVLDLLKYTVTLMRDLGCPGYSKNIWVHPKYFDTVSKKLTVNMFDVELVNKHPELLYDWLSSNVEIHSKVLESCVRGVLSGKSTLGSRLSGDTCNYMHGVPISTDIWKDALAEVGVTNTNIRDYSSTAAVGYGELMKDTPNIVKKVAIEVGLFKDEKAYDAAVNKEAKKSLGRFRKNIGKYESTPF